MIGVIFAKPGPVFSRFHDVCLQKHSGLEPRPAFLRSSILKRPGRGVQTEFLKEKGVDVGFLRHAVFERGTDAVAGGGGGAQ